MNAKRILKKLRGESDRQSTTVYFSQTIWKEFKESCGEVPSSRVLEELMLTFIDDLSAKAKAPIIKKAASKKN